MPFPEYPRRVAGMGQHFRHRDFPSGQTVIRGKQRHRAVATAHRISSRHQGRAAGCALRLDVEIERAESFACQAIQPGGRSAAYDAASINAKFAPTKIIHQHQNEVGFGALF